ncbi:hypothetical protein LCGC14_0448730 [marine sediment metagenome]|uniref:AAA+ ATPase domain-containing protein n=1 Tax=marine sediment metagenome TaxID=412755 RepID=A0A0F9T1I7_9ZZZZ
MKLTFPDNDIISSGILTRQSRLCVGGHPGIGKSVIVTQIGQELSMGVKILGKFDCKVPQRVLYIQEEIGPRSYQIRLEKIISFYKKSDTFWHLSSTSFTFEDKVLIVKLKSFILQNKIDIVIFDPLYKIHARRENDPSDMAQLFQTMDRLINECGVAVIIVHHLRKPFMTYRGDIISMGSMDFRGAIIASWADTLALLEETDIKDRLKLSWVKTRNAPEELRPLYLHFDRNYLRMSPIGDGSQPVNLHEEIVNILQAKGGVSESNIISQLKVMHGKRADSKSVRTEINNLSKSGSIAISGGLITIVVSTVYNPWDLDGA